MENNYLEKFVEVSSEMRNNEKHSYQNMFTSEHPKAYGALKIDKALEILNKAFFKQKSTGDSFVYCMALYAECKKQELLEPLEILLAKNCETEKYYLYLHKEGLIFDVVKALNPHSLPEDLFIIISDDLQIDKTNLEFYDLSSNEGDKITLSEVFEIPITL